MQTEKVWESQGQYFTKIPILIGDYINKKGIGVANNVIPKTEYRWIDTDYTVHPSKNHPPIPPLHGGADAISWILAHNRKYSIGKVVDIDRITNADNGIHTLKGTIKFEEPQLAKQAYQLGVIPLYNSSSIYETARDESTGLTTDYVPIDNCAVDTPAGDLELFKTGTFCEGGNECIHDLKQSGINSECGYCKLEALKSFKFHYAIGTATSVHDSHNSLGMKQSSSMSEQVTEGSKPPAANQEPSSLDTTKEVKNQQNKSKSKSGARTGAGVEKLGKEINDSGWVSSNEDRSEEEEKSEPEDESEQEKEPEAKLDYKKLYEDEKVKNETNNKTVQELLAESRLNKVKEKFTTLPLEIWEGDDKARMKDVEFFNSLYEQKIDEKLLNKLIEKYVSKIPIQAIQEANKRVGLKQSGGTSGWSPLDEIVTHNFIARTNRGNEESQLSEGDIVLGALED